MNIRLLVIGSSGQIGSGIMTFCRSHGISAIGLDSRQNPWCEGLTDIVTDFSIYTPSDVETYTDVVFLATEASAKRLEIDSAAFKKDAILFDKAVELAKKWHARFVIVSSRELFGLGDNDLTNFNPLNKYQLEKVLFERALIEMRHYGYSTGIIRVPIVCGGFDTDIDRLDRLVPRWCDQMLRVGQVLITNGMNEVQIEIIDEVVSRLMYQISKDSSSFIVEDFGYTVCLNDLAAEIKSVASSVKKKYGEDSYPLREVIERTIIALKHSHSVNG